MSAGPRGPGAERRCTDRLSESGFPGGRSPRHASRCCASFSPRKGGAAVHGGIRCATRRRPWACRAPPRIRGSSCLRSARSGVSRAGMTAPSYHPDGHPGPRDRPLRLRLHRRQRKGFGDTAADGLSPTAQRSGPAAIRTCPGGDAPHVREHLRFSGHRLRFGPRVLLPLSSPRRGGGEDTEPIEYALAFSGHAVGSQRCDIHTGAH